MKNFNNIKRLIIGGMILILIAAFISCTGSKNSVGNIKEDKLSALEKKLNDEDYSGIYNLSDAKACKIVITIKKDKNNYTYTINGTAIKSTGKLSVVKDQAETYLVFTGTKRSGDKTSVEGAYLNKTITVQNYGNSMNQYICFKSCDAKFLEFVKAD